MTTKSPILPTASDVRDTAEHARARIVEVATATRDAGAAIVSEVRDRAAETLDVAMDAAATRAESAKSSIADAGERLADGLRDAARDADGDSLQARSLNLIAGGIAEAARGLNARTLSTMLGDARQFARRNPGLFVVGAAVAGFALVRMLKASGDTADDAAKEAGTEADGSYRPRLRNQQSASS